MAGIYNGYLLEFPQIRVDCFTRYNDKWTIPSVDDPAKLVKPPHAQCYLLSHVHSDHLMGLTAPWTGDIHCSYETKAMLVKLETRNEQELKRTGARDTMIKTYDFLKPRSEVRIARTVNGKEEHRRMLVDHLKPHAYDDPFEIDVGMPEKITVVLLNASHCPGSVMFLVKNSQRAILHTGDVRADAPMLYSLRRNPHVSQYLPEWAGMPTSVCASSGGPGQTLDRIYLDTSAMMGTGDMPDKESAVRGLLELMVMYPEDTVFAMNTWTWGWEDVLKGVALTFKTKVHSDRYKFDVLAHLPSEPLLRNCLTLDSSSTRFHACGPSKCAGCRTWEDGVRKYNVDKLVVHVNMVEVQLVAWEAAKKQVQVDLIAAKKGKRPFPTNLHCPFARHAPLPELQNLVATFRPRSLSPNTVLPQCKLMDYIVMARAFEHCLSGGEAQMLRETTLFADAAHGPGYTATIRRSGVRLPERKQAQTQFDWQPEQKPTAFSSMAQFVDPLAADRASNRVSQAINLGLDPEAASVIASRANLSKRKQEDSESPVTEDDAAVKKSCVEDGRMTAGDEAQRLLLRQKMADRASSRVAVKAEMAMAGRTATQRTSFQVKPVPLPNVDSKPAAPAIKVVTQTKPSSIFIHRPWKSVVSAELGKLDSARPCFLNLDELRSLLDSPVPARLDLGDAGCLMPTLHNALWFDRCLSLAAYLDRCAATSQPCCSRSPGSLCAVVLYELKHMADFERHFASAETDDNGRRIDLQRLRAHPHGVIDRQDVERELASCAEASKTIAPVLSSAASFYDAHTDNLPSILAVTNASIRAQESLLISTLLRACRLPVGGDQSACLAQQKVFSSLMLILHRHLSCKIDLHRKQNLKLQGPAETPATCKAEGPDPSTKRDVKARPPKTLAPVDTSHFKNLFAQSQTKAADTGS